MAFTLSVIATFIALAQEQPVVCVLRAAVPTRVAAVDRPLPVRAAVREPVAQRATHRRGSGVNTMAVKSTKKAAAKKTASTSASKRIDQRIADLGDWRGERLAEIRKLIREVDPARIGSGWARPSGRTRGCAPANAHKDKVKLTFFHGAKLPDPKKLFNAGAGDKWRAIDLREGDRIDKAALKVLLREAVVYNTKHSVLKSKGSRA